jgi:hypothetical protein
MKKSGLFNINVPLPSNRAMLKDGDIAQPTAPIGVINANQSAITFAGAPVLVSIIWKIVGLVFPSILETTIFPVSLSLIVGMLIYWQSAPTGASTKEKMLGFTFALLNSFAIAAAVLGINSATSGS